MNSNAKANLRYLARSTTATIALVAGGYLAISGSTAEPAAGESTNNSRKNETWIEKSLGGPEFHAKVDAQEQVDNKAGKDGELIAASKSSNESHKNETWIEEFSAGPKSDAKDDAQEQVDNEAGKDGKSIAASKSSNKSGKEDKLVQNAFRPGPKYEF